jgi:hypothetical protein
MQTSALFRCPDLAARGAVSKVDAEKAVATASGYFRVAGLVSEFTAASVVPFSTDEGAGRAPPCSYRIDRRTNVAAGNRRLG